MILRSSSSALPDRPVLQGCINYLNIPSAARGASGATAPPVAAGWKTMGWVERRVLNVPPFYRTTECCKKKKVDFYDEKNEDLKRLAMWIQ